MSRRSTYDEKYNSQGYFAPGDALDDSVTGTETTNDDVTDGSPGAAKRINAKPYEPIDYSKNPYGNSNNEYFTPTTPGNAEPTVVKGKSNPTKPSGKKGDNNGGNSGAGGGGGNCPCAEEKKKQTQTGADIKAKAEQAATTGATGGRSTTPGGGSGSSGSAGATSNSGSGECDCEHDDSVVNPNNETIDKKETHERNIIIYNSTLLNEVEDVECKTTDKVAMGLRNTVLAIKQMAKRASVESGNTGDPKVRECGFIVVTKKNELDLSDEKSTSLIYPKNFVRSNHSGDIGLNYLYGLNEFLLASYHTHIYSRKQGSYTGLPHSIRDLSNLRNFEQNFMAIVDSDTKRFAIVITNFEKAQKYFAKYTEEDLTNKFREILHEKANENSTKEELIDAALSSLVKTIGSEEETGLGFYETVNINKDCFKKLN